MMAADFAIFQAVKLQQLTMLRRWLAGLLQDW
jgi:hypothetical protein